MRNQLIDPADIQQRLEDIGLIAFVEVLEQNKRRSIIRLILRNVPTNQDFLQLLPTILPLFVGEKTINMHRLAYGNIVVTLTLRPPKGETA